MRTGEGCASSSLKGGCFDYRLIATVKISQMKPWQSILRYKPVTVQFNILCDTKTNISKNITNNVQESSNFSLY